MRYGLVTMPEGDQQRHRRRTRRRWARRGLEIVLVGAALYLAIKMFSAVGWSALEDQLRHADPRLVGLVVVLLLGRWLIWNARWRLALEASDLRVSRSRSLFAILAAAALNHLTPSFRLFGGLVRARYVSEQPTSGFATAYGAVIFDQLVNQTVAGFLTAIAFVGLSWRLGRPAEVLAGSLVVLSIVLLIPLLYRHLRRRGLLPSPSGEPDVASHVGPRLRPLAERSREVVATLQKLARDRSLVLRAAGLGLLLAALNLAAAWMSFAALGSSVPVLWVFFAVSLGVTLGAISGTPGGGLTTEAAMVTCYSLLGVDQTAALAATLLYRGLHYALVLLLGVPSLLTLEALHRQRVTGEGSAADGEHRPGASP